jgi:deoxyribodipyrimidine photo-lyase
MEKKTTLVWFRRDLRLRDNPALNEAARRGAPVAVYVRDIRLETARPPGRASRWWLHGSLRRLEMAATRRGIPFFARRGDAAMILPQLAREHGADRVVWNRLYEPDELRQESRVVESLRAAGIAGEGFRGALLFEPGRILSKEGKPYRVFTPFWQACAVAAEPEAPCGDPPLDHGAPPARSSGLDELGYAGEHEAPAWEKHFVPGEEAAGKVLALFLRGAAADYDAARDFPGRPGTSRLAARLHFGELAVGRVWKEAYSGAADPGRRGGFLSELGWRDFAHHVLFHFPATVDRPMNERFENFRWRVDEDALSAWKRGATGYPVVDAAMRELSATGWMHNRSRMIVASFLVKDLLIDWRRGAEWFEESLLDADLANNTMGWQWSAGCGADAAPFFRIFNPVEQGRRWDPDGAYVRRWVPELARLPDRRLHAPWEALPAELAAAGVVLGGNYPQRIVDHTFARERALAAFGALRAASSGVKR